MPGNTGPRGPGEHRAGRRGCLPRLPRASWGTLTEHEVLARQHRAGSHRAASAGRSVRRQPGAAHCGPPAVAGSAAAGPPGRAIRTAASANARSVCGAPPDRRTRRGYYDAQSIWPVPMIRQGGWRACAAQECAASRPEMISSRCPGAVPGGESGTPRIPRRSIVGTPTAYFIREPHCGAPGELNVMTVPRSMRNAK